VWTLCTAWLLQNKCLKLKTSFCFKINVWNWKHNLCSPCIWKTVCFWYLYFIGGNRNLICDASSPSLSHFQNSRPHYVSKLLLLWCKYSYCLYKHLHAKTSLNGPSILLENCNFIPYPSSGQRQGTVNTSRADTWQ
jgi:hypothetical protein